MRFRTLRFYDKTIFAIALLFASNIAYVAYAQEETTRHVPLFPSSNDMYAGALRIINHSKESGSVSIVGFDEAGTEHGPAMLSIASQDSVLIYTDELENGTDSITGGLGRGVGSWRLRLTTSLDAEANAYASAQDGLLFDLQETVQGENGCWRIPVFYSPDNFSVSKLRLTNPGTSTANIKISGRDDRGTISASPIELTLRAGMTKSFMAEELETGTGEFSGSLGDGRGNWQLAVEADRLITVMNLLETERFLSNVSKKPSDAVGHCWLGTTLANADRSIVDLINVFVQPDRLEGRSPITPAIYASIIDETGVRAIAATGVKKIGENKQASIHDRLFLGSITKPMTATMVATLIYGGERIFTNDWDTSISDVFGDLLDDIHRDYHDVTIKELLTHHGRIQENLPEWEDDASQTIVERRQAAMLATLSERATIERGNVSYSHAGYMVAAAMAERLTGKSWEDLMRERLFDPLGMASAGFGPPAVLDSENEPWGHKLSDSFEWLPTQEDWHVVLLPTAGVHSSMEDLGKFLQLWMDGKEPMLLNRAQIQSLTRLAVREDGTILTFLFSGGSPSAGWWLYQDVFGYGEALNTPGSNGNWYSLVWVMRDISRAYFVVTNSALSDELLNTSRASINRVLTPVITRLATSPARSEPPQLSSDAPD